MVTLGNGQPIGDIGNRRTDTRLLEAILMPDGPAARLLRRHGIDKSALEAFRRGTLNEPKYKSPDLPRPGTERSPSLDADNGP